jgi:hypothetical protein
VSWRGKLVRRLERADKAGHAKYYLLFAEDPERKGDFASSRPFLVDEAKATVGKGVEAALTEGGSSSTRRGTRGGPRSGATRSSWL